MRPVLLAVTSLAWLLLPASWARSDGPGQALPTGPVFRNVTRASGIRFTHRYDLKNGKMIATQGGGAALADFDGDGWLDLYCVNSVAAHGKPNEGNCGVLWRNQGVGADGVPVFRDVTEGSGIVACGWGQGATWTDVDGDGDPDLLQTNFGRNQLFLNGGPDASPRFRDVSEESGLGAVEGFHVGAGFFDADRDGDLDLYVADYLITDLESERRLAAMDLRLPEEYEAAPNHYFRNEGGLRFTERTAEVGLENPGGKSLGVAPQDYDGDGWTDLYVANDRTPNALFRNNRDGTFTDVAVERGCAFNENGIALSGMGLAIGDYDEEGNPDIFVTNFADEWNSLFLAIAPGFYQDATGPSGLGPVSYPRVGWGTGPIDYDNDGHLDLYVNNGNLMPRWFIWLLKVFGKDKEKVKQYDVGETYAQAPLLFLGRGDGTFEPVTGSAGDLGQLRLVGRGSAAGDLDRDGDIDLFLMNTAGFPRPRRPSVVLRNDGGNRLRALGVRLVAGPDRRTVLGSQVRLTVGGRTLRREWQVQPSYASGSDTPVWFGLGEAPRVEGLAVTWPDGEETTFANLAAGSIWTIARDGAIAPAPFRPVPGSSPTE